MRTISILTILTMAATPAMAHPGHADPGGSNMVWAGLALLALAFGVGLYRGTRAANPRHSA